MGRLSAAGIFGLRSSHIGTPCAGLHNIHKGMGSLPFCQATLRGVRCPWGPYATEKKGYPASPKNLGEHIRKRRLDLGLRQIEAAKMIGCDEMSLVAWEKGYRTPRIDHLGKVVEFLGFDPFPKCDTLAQKLVNFRKASGFSQKVLAAKLGVDPGTLAQWERGCRKPAAKHPVLLANFLR